jgi:hypothetical protein
VNGGGSGSIRAVLGRCDVLVGDQGPNTVLKS